MRGSDPLTYSRYGGGRRARAALRPTTDRPPAPTIKGMTPTNRLGRLADLAYRRRGRMVLAWIAALGAVIALAPVFADDFEADFGTNGSESEEVAQLLDDRFDRSGEFVTVAWEGANTPGAQRTVDGFLDRAHRVGGVGGVEATRVSPDGTI